MKTITMKEDGQSTYSFEDSVVVTLGANGTQMPNGTIDVTVTPDTATLWESIALPTDWEPAKYCFDGTSWTPNPWWIDPPAPLPSKEVQSAARAEAYRNESDPLFFKAQRGEATMGEWLALVAEIKMRYPYPT
jgi:hypothetical protein